MVYIKLAICCISLPTFPHLEGFLSLVVSGVMPLGGGPSASASGGRGHVEGICEMASAWCCWLPLQILEALPFNKLNDSQTLDLDLGFLAASSSALLWMQACSAAPLLAGRGGEVKGSSGSFCPTSGDLVVRAEGAPSPRAVTLPARGRC
jgi:hypothetical protein